MRAWLAATELFLSVVQSISDTAVVSAWVVTGAPPEVHGIRAFTDDFASETLFGVVRAHGGRSAGVGQSGYTGSELLGRAADLWGKASSNTDDEVEALALGFAAEEAPQFLVVQLGTTDDVFHRWGPSSPQIVRTLRETDQRLARMADRLTSLGYALVINADHGQHDTGPGGSHGTADDEDALVPCTWLA